MMWPMISRLVIDYTLSVATGLYARGRLPLEDLERLVLFLEEKGCLLGEHLLYHLSRRQHP